MPFDFRIILFIALVIIFALVRRRQEQNKKKDNRLIDDLKNMDDIFFLQANGRKVIPIIRTYNPSDLMILRSLLDSSGINTLVNFSEMNSLYPNMRIEGHTDTIIYIYESDRENAEEIATNYIENIVSISSDRRGGKFRNVAEFVLGGVIMPSGKNRTKPELLNQSKKRNNK